ncbi:MAG TPA: hypothetical protein VJR89_01935, partial [Polyangiales bacterium]|nr:hypothetical protein [Polyangiales bacterium]
MRHWILPLSAALATLFSAAAADPARACSYPEANLVPVGLVQPVPDPNNPPVVPAGGEILVIEPCWIAGCASTNTSRTIKIVASGGAERPVQVDLISQIPEQAGWRLWRVHPQPALQPGRYTLQLQYRSPEDAAPKDGSYPFAVSGTVSETSSAKFELKASPLMEATGTGFACQ